MLYMLPNCKNMHMVHRTSEGNELWLGNWAAATDTKLLASKNIKYVYTAAALDVSYPKEHGITHRRIQALDAPQYNMAQHFSSAYSFLTDCLQKGNVLVHCAAGISRSATIVIMYLMKTNAWQLEKTISHVRDKRPIISPNPGFINQLRRFQTSLKQTIELQKQQNAVFKFLNEESEGRKTATSFMSKSLVRQTPNSKNTTMRGFSTQKSNIFPQQTKTQFRASDTKSGGMYKSLLREPLGFDITHEPKIIRHNR